MTIFREQEAIDYLNRASSIVQSETGYFSSLSLLYHMLDIEAAYINRLMNIGPIDLAHININATGFPEPSSWLVDLRRAFKDYDSIKVDRQQRINPLIEQFLNSSTKGIIEESTKLSRHFTADIELAEAVQLVPKNIQQLIQREDSDFPLYLSPDNNGLIITDAIKLSKSLWDLGWVEDMEDCMVLDKNEGSMPKVVVPHYSGFKYIDGLGKGNKNSPCILFCGLEKHNFKVSKTRLLVSDHPLLERSRYDKNTWVKSSDLMLKAYRLLDSTQPITSSFCNEYVLGMNIADAEPFLNQLNPSVFKALLYSDLASLSQAEKDCFFQALIRFDDNVKQTITFIQGLQEDLTFTPKRLIDKSSELALELDSTYKALPNKSLEAKFRLARPEVMQVLVKIKTDKKPPGFISRLMGRKSDKALPSGGL